MTALRIGQGYDVHRITEGRKLILGGVEIPWSGGFWGTRMPTCCSMPLWTQLLGAAGLGDIGRLFPDSDPAYAGISSLELLRRVADALGEKGFSVVNLDATLVAQAPKIGPYRRQMEENIAAGLAIPVDRVNVKATTEEGLGFTGSGAGMAAQAIALLEQCKDK